ncbi:hypothetical protein FACS189446_6210 [Bacteroidia bacterium]|nr:hypothetical protein FACS189446_6210 [Bacteroidia bacterium]
MLAGSVRAGEKKCTRTRMKSKILAAMLVCFLCVTPVFAQTFTVTQNGSTVGTYSKSLTAVYESAQRLNSEAKSGSTVIYARNNNSTKTYYKFQGETFHGSTTSESDASSWLYTYTKSYVFCSDGLVYGARTNGKNPVHISGQWRETSSSCAAKYTIPLSYWVHSMTATIDFSNTQYAQNSNYPENLYVYGALGWDNGYIELGFIKAPNDNVWKFFYMKDGGAVTPTGYTIPLNSSNITMEWRLEYNTYKCFVNGVERYSFSCNEENIRTHNPRFYTMTSIVPDYGNNNGNGNCKITNMSSGTFFGPVKWKNVQINYISGRDVTSNFWTTDGITEEANFISDHTCQVIENISNPYAGEEVITLSRTGSFTPPTNAPANDNCTSAELLSCGTAKTGTMVGATRTSSIIYSDGGDKNDVFYKFTATNTGNYTLTLTKSNNSDDIDAHLYSNCNVTTTSFPKLTNNRLTETITYNNLAAGTYLIRLIDYKANGTSGNFSIKVDCPSPITPPTAITRPATNITQTTATLDMSIMAGTEAITSFGYKYKKQSESSWQTSTTGSLSGLTANTVYQFYAYVTTVSGTYNGNTLTFTTLANVSAPSNDQCSNATSLSCGTTVSGTLVGATPSTIYGNYTTFGDVFYQFTAANSGNHTITFTKSNSSDDIDVKVYQGCSSTTELASIGANGITETTTFNCTAGTNYRIRVVSSNNNGSGGFSIKVDCPAAASLTVSPSSYNFPANGGTSSAITVTSNVSWTVSDDASWLTTSKTSGSNNSTFTMTATANTSTSSRNAEVSVTGGGITREISVTQDTPQQSNCKTPPEYDSQTNTPTTSMQYVYNECVQSAGACRVYRVPVTSGTKYTFRCDDGDSFDSQLYLYDNSGNQLTYKDATGAGGDEVIEDYKINYTGYAYVKVKGYTSSTGCYHFGYSRIAGTGIETVEAAGISVYPNPAKDELSIKSDFPIKKIEICDLSGKPMITGKLPDSKTIDVSALPSGLYLVKITTDSGVVVKKIVKE